MSIAERLHTVRQRIADAARAANRDPDTVTLVAVCKRQPIDRILAAHDEGVRDFGESTVQGLCDTAELLARDGREVRWHFVGRLQRNKINKLLPHLGVLHTLDRAELARSVDQRAEREVDVLVQVNIGDEAQKAGIEPDAAVELAEQVAALPNLRLRGLMAMPPAAVDPRPYFESLSLLSQQLQQRQAGQGADALSMGMTEDFEIAIACGATHVRVGTAIFGERATKTERPA